MKAATERSIAADIDTIQSEISALATRSGEAVELAAQIRTELYPEGDALRTRIAEARRTLASQLKLTESDVLSEVDQNPEDHGRRWKEP